MNGQQLQVPPKRATRRVKTVVLVLLSFVALYVGYHLVLSLVIQRQINSIRRAGFPATCAELDKWYAQPPAGQNAADVYLEAFAHFDNWTNKLTESSIPADFVESDCYSPPKVKHDLLPVIGFAKLPSRSEPLPAGVRRLVSEYLSDNAEALRLLHQAASMKSCRYPIDLTKGVEMRPPPFFSLRQAERLLYLEAIFNSDRQQPEEAVKSVIAALGVSQSLSQEPTLISCLVQLACQGMSLDCLQRVFNGTPLTDRQLTELDVAVEKSEDQQSLTRAFVGERCFGDDLFERLRSGKIPFVEVEGLLDEENYWIGPLLPLYKAAGLLELDEKRYLDIMGRYVKATQLPAPQSIAAAGRVDDELKRLSRWRVFSRMLLGSLDSTARRTERYDAKIRDAQTAIAVERYRVANGKLPDQLSDLAPIFLPTVPTDPFDGMPLRFRKLAKGYVVYSVGEDREDNSGTEKNSEGNWYGKGTDIPFTVER